MNNKNTIYIFLLLIGGYFLFRNKKKGSIIIEPLTTVKAYAKKGSKAYAKDLSTPIYTFTKDTLIEILDFDEIRGIYKIEYGNGVLQYGYIINSNIIFK